MPSLWMDGVLSPECFELQRDSVQNRNAGEMSLTVSLQVIDSL